MPVLSAQELCKRYGERVLFEQVKFTLEPGERVGVVGHNGSGKSTLARILAGIDEADGGQVVCARGLELRYLEQEPDLPADATAVQVVLSGLGEWSRAVARHEQLNAALGERSGDATAPGRAELDAMLAEQERVAATVERLGGWDLAHRAQAMLGHLGVMRPESPVGPMSGGERRRVALAQILVAEPDVAILDEPTNHLDIDTIEWLETYLRDRFRGALLLITHDRYLLDRVVSRTLEIDGARVYSYDGGWERYLAGKAEREAHEQRVQANRRNILRRELEWMRRQPKARTTKQKARSGRAEALMDAGNGERKRMVSFLVQKTRSGHTVLDMEDLAVDIAGKRLVNGLTLRLGKRERVGIVGPNGCGKTSLLRVLLGELEPAEGVVRLGKNTRIAYLDQLRSGLDDTQTIYETVANGRSHVKLGGADVSVHSYLDRFMFSSRVSNQKVGTLSGGERARVALARLLVNQSNLVILDEPTNDLDVTTLSALEGALDGFDGSVLCVTHDRFFLDRVATSILAFDPADHGDADHGDEFDRRSNVVHVQGNYRDYLRYRELRVREARADAKSPVNTVTRAAVTSEKSAHAKGKSKGLTYGEEIELQALPERIEAAETMVASLEAEMAEADFHQRDHTEQAAFFQRLADAKREADELVERWADLESRNE